MEETAYNGTAETWYGRCGGLLLIHQAAAWYIYGVYGVCALGQRSLLKVCDVGGMLTTEAMARRLNGQRIAEAPSFRTLLPKREKLTIVDVLGAFNRPTVNLVPVVYMYATRSLIRAPGVLCFERITESPIC